MQDIAVAAAAVSELRGPCANAGGILLIDVGGDGPLRRPERLSAVYHKASLPMKVALLAGAVAKVMPHRQRQSNEFT
jgi:hypothetical protein